MFNSLVAHLKTLISEYRSRPEQSFIVFQAYLGSFFIGLFGIWRLIQADIALAVVDLSMVFALLALAYFAARDLYFRYVTLCFICVVVVGSWATVIYGGDNNLYWAFPVIPAIFYVLRIRDAMWVNLVGLVGLSLLIQGTHSNWIGFVASYLLVTLYAFQFAYLMKTDNERLTLEASIDPLTGVGNRRALDDAMIEAIEAFSQDGEKHSLIMIDIDFFKRINDDYGHNVGDLCLKRMAATVGELLPPRAQLYRFGGEEFTVLCRCDLESAVALAETIRIEVEAAELIRQRPVTVSSGVAELLPNNDAREWFHGADVLLYLAKHQGRNRVCAQQPSGSERTVEHYMGEGI